MSPRTQAIDHLQKAESNIRTSGVVNTIAIDSMRATKARADLVFNDSVQSLIKKMNELAALR